MDVNQQHVKKLFDTLAYKNGKYIGKKLPKPLVDAINSTDFGDIKTYKEKVYALLTNNYVRPKCYCGNFTNLITTTIGYAKFCSKKCSAQSTDTKAARENTNMQKFGVKNPGMSDDIKQKIAATSVSRYGTTNPLSSSKVREKSIATLVKRYGVVNPGQTEKSRARAKLTLSSPEIRKKLSDVFIKKYGVDNPLKSKDFREVLKNGMVKKYGVEHRMQIPEQKEKQRKSQALHYANNFLDTRLHGISLFGIFPNGWSKETFTGGQLEFIHTECGNVFTTSFEDGKLPSCPHCKRPKSMVQSILAQILAKYCDIIENDRTAIYPKEIDILVGKIGVEVNGVYWHSDESVSVPLIEKTKLAAEKGIMLLHFWDYEVTNKLDIVTSIILSKLKLSTQRILARQCIFGYATVTEVKRFFDDNHLEGFCPGEKYYVLRKAMAMIVGKSRFSRGNIELIRLCSKKFTYVVGGFSKLLSYVKKDYAGQILVSFADKRYSDGASYEKEGFLRVSETKPNYFWIKGNKRLKRYSTQKRFLPRLLGNSFNPDKTEKENMYDAGWLRITDCGNIKFQLKL
jgi:hypothetical protein